MSLLKHMERWEDVKGYEGLYQVSNCGRVKSLGNDKTRKERILKHGKQKNGYLFVVLFKYGKGKPFKIHRLVANAFIPNTENLPQVNHKNENKEMNYVWNLEWCDAKYNINYGTRNKKISKKIMCIETGIVYTSAIEAQRQTGICNSNIGKCCKGKHKKAGGYQWQYAD